MTDWKWTGLKDASLKQSFLEYTKYEMTGPIVGRHVTQLCEIYDKEKSSDEIQPRFLHANTGILLNEINRTLEIIDSHR